MSPPLSPDEARGYSRGYAAGQRRLERESSAEARRTEAAIDLFQSLVEGLMLQGLTLDAVLDAQIAGAMARGRDQSEC